MSVKLVLLGEIATIIAGQSPPGSTYNESGLGLPFFQGKADFGRIHPVARKWCVAPKKIAEAGDILISIRAPVGPTNIAGERCCIGRGLAAIRTDETIALRDFVHWTIKYRESEFVAKGKGSTFVAIGKKDLDSFPIPLPPLDEQRRIADILNRAARIENLCARADKYLRDFIPALFVTMFGDPIENPMGWRVTPLVELMEEFRYGTSKKCDDIDHGDAIPILRIPNIVNNSINWNDLKFTSLGISDIERLCLKNGDILFVRTNGNPDYIGRCAVFNSNRPTAYASYLIRARLKTNGIVDPQYISNILALPSMRQIILKSAQTTAGNYNISIKNLGGIRIPIPAQKFQQRFLATIAMAKRIASTTDAAVQASSTLSASLITMLLEGGA